MSLGSGTGFPDTCTSSVTDVPTGGNSIVVLLNTDGLSVRNINTCNSYCMKLLYLSTRYYKVCFRNTNEAMDKY